jgi:hypothetical protein
MDPTNDPSLAIRPTREAIRRSQLKDLERPGFVVILHTGERLLKPAEAQEESDESSK